MCVEITVASVIGDMGTILTAELGWVGEVATTVASNPILLIFTIGTFALIAVGIFRRLLNI